MRQALYLLLFVITVLTAQTASAQDGTIVFTPQWTAQAQFAGYYVAEVKGFYREAGVKVRIEHPSATPSITVSISRGVTIMPASVCASGGVSGYHITTLSGNGDY